MSQSKQPSNKNQPMKHRKQHPAHQSTVKIGNTVVGGPEAAIIAGPCSVESYEQLKSVAERLKKIGVHCIRGGAYKPRTSPYAFQGLGEQGLELLSQIGKEFDLAVVSEVMAINQIAIMHDHVDCYQVGARNMQNFDLLKALGQAKKPILLKRGLAATVDEFLMAAEYIMAHGNAQVILCERGIRSFDQNTRNVLDLGAVALLKERTHLPVIVDPSHGTGVKSLVTPAARAGIAVGSDGIIVEAHPIPEESVSDAAQALTLDELETLVKQCRIMSAALDHCLSEPLKDRPLKIVTG